MKNKLFLFLATSCLLFSCGGGASNSKVDSSSTSSSHSETSQSVSSESISSKEETSESVSSESISSETLSSESVSSESVESTVSSSSSSESFEPTVTQKNMQLIESGSSEEALYMTWYHVEGATSYKAFYKAKDASEYTQVNDMLIRSYSDYCRLDIVGLVAGKYDVKVVPYQDEVALDSSLEVDFDVEAHIREGYGFVEGSASGAYNDDGSLKKNAIVVYVTKKNAKTVSATLGGVKRTGIQDILAAKEKGDQTPLDIRVVGCLEASDFDYLGSSSEGLQIKGKNSFSPVNITLEGIGEDACFKGVGILIRNCDNVEIRNMGFLNFPDDGVSIDTDNSHLWVHHNDFFYGKNGGGDKAKGDGALDTKVSKLVTHSFNHFWDSGKCNLQGMKSESEDNRITYHHNWFDHSDSRHPRVRTCTVHVYNNYYDGNAKYGIGATMGCSIFSEANYFRHTKYPMLTSLQGSDIATDPKGTFSSEEGGSIKSFNDYMTQQTRFVSYQNDPVEFDAYVASSRDEEVPNDVKSKSGSHTYSNFDTKDTMYKYNVQTPEEAKATVTSKAGRVGGGDLQYNFTDADDTLYEINAELAAMVANYKTTLVSVQGDVSSAVVDPSTPVDPDDPSTPVDPGDGDETDSVIRSNVDHNFTTSGLSSKYFSISGNLSTSKGTVNYNGEALTQCLKLESATKIDFEIENAMTLTLILNETFSGRIKIDGTASNAVNGVFTISLEPGKHSITKGDSGNIYYMSLSMNS